MERAYYSHSVTNNKSSKQTQDIIRNIRIKTQMQLSENASPNCCNPISFRGSQNNNKYTHNSRRDNKRQKVTIFFSQGLKYQGEVTNDKFDGFGIISKDGIQLYVGSFFNGSFHGFGRLMNSEQINLQISVPFSNWIAYSGQFEYGLFQGMGTLVLENKQKFLGRFSNGKVMDQGVFYRNKSAFIGQWEEHGNQDRNERDE